MPESRPPIDDSATSLAELAAAIDARGRVLGQLKPFTIGSLDVRIEGTSGFTPYVTSGNNIVLAVSLVLLAFGFTFGPGLRRRNGRKNGDGQPE